MKLFAALVAVGALCQTAAAQTPDCKSYSSPTARLACYDKAAAAAPASAPTPATVAAKPRLRAIPPSKVDGTKYVDSLGNEDARVNAQLKNICRGC
jgi:hypothetical protein